MTILRRVGTVGVVGRFVRDDRAEGTSSGAIRIVVWAVVVLGLLALVGPKIYSAFDQTSKCQNAAGGFTTSTFSSGSGATPTC